MAAVSSIETALAIALRVRKACESLALSTQHDVDWRGSRSLRCMCAVASRALTLALRSSGIDAKFVVGNFSRWPSDTRGNHCWVEVDGVIIDITATQFGFSRRIIRGKYSTHRTWRPFRSYRRPPAKLWNLRSQDPLFVHVGSVLRLAGLSKET